METTPAPAQSAAGAVAGVTSYRVRLPSCCRLPSFSTELYRVSAARFGLVVAASDWPWPHREVSHLHIFPSHQWGQPFAYFSFTPVRSAICIFFLHAKMYANEPARCRAPEPLDQSAAIHSLNWSLVDLFATVISLCSQLCSFHGLGCIWSAGIKSHDAIDSVLGVFFSLIGFDRVFINFSIGFYCVVPSFIGFYWVLPVLNAFSGFGLGYRRFHRVFDRFHGVFPSCHGF